MSISSPQPSFWLEFRLLSDGHETAAVRALPLTKYHASHNPIFTFFPMLPTELRLKIWEYLIAPRIIGVACLCLDEGSPTVEQQYDELWGSRDAQTRASTMPVLLHVNRETRELALKHYELSFEWKLPQMLREGRDLPPPVAPRNWPVRTPEEVKPRPTHSPPRTWFNFSLDTVYLLGELEPCDSFGFNSPMPYFMSWRDCKRVRTVAVAFRALRYGETGGQQIFGALFHVVDRFVPHDAHDGRVFVTVAPADEWTHAMLGNDFPLIADPRPPEQAPEEEDGEVGANGYQPPVRARDLRRRRAQLNPVDNVVQRHWRDWYRALVDTPLSRMQFVLVREEELENHVYDSVMAGLDKGKRS